MIHFPNIATQVKGAIIEFAAKVCFEITQMVLGWFVDDDADAALRVVCNDENYRLLKVALACHEVERVC